MQAVILAGGVGSRLAAATGGRPKCLIEFDGRPLILHQLEALADHGIGPTVCVLGHQAERVRAVIGNRAEVVVNDRYEETNSLYSLWLAREHVRGPFVLMNSDLLVDPSVLEELLEAPGTALAYDSTSSRGREQTKVVVRKQRVVDLGKDLPGTAAQGESLGLLKFDAEGAQAMLEVADQLIRDGMEQAWVIEATRAVCARLPVRGVNVAGRPWAEIDFSYDLDVARREVWPAIWKRRWRKQVYWRRTRWGLAALGAASLAILGYYLSTRVGPASVDWESVPPAGAKAVRLMHEADSQRWWLLSAGDTAVAQANGPDIVIEARLVLPETGAPGRARYVLAVSADGRPHDWEALTATRDSTALLDGRPVGDRDRVLVSLTPGPHELGVRLVEGHGNRLLVRIRQREER